MSDVLARLAGPEGSRHKERRIGRGPGSTQGKMGGRGFKGQKARNGGNIGKLHFQGGQTPIQRRLPKRGFRVPFPVRTVEINIGLLERFDDGTTVDEQAMRDARLIQGHDRRQLRIKLLGNGELTKKLTVSAHRCSKSAEEKIKKAGGSIVSLQTPSDSAKAE